MLKRNAALGCGRGIGLRNCGNTGGHSVRSDRAGSADIAQAESGHRVAAGTAGRHDTRAAMQGTQEVDSSVGTPGDEVAVVAVPKKQLGNTRVLVGWMLVVNRALGGGVLQLMVWWSTVALLP